MSFVEYFFVGDFHADWCWDGSPLIVVEGDKQGVKDAWRDILEVVAMVLSISKWVQVEHMVVDIEKSEWRLDGLSSHIPFVGKTLLLGSTCPIERLIKKRLIVFYLSSLDTLFYAFLNLDQVGKHCVGVANESVIVCQGQSIHEDCEIFLFGQGWLYMGGSLAPPLCIFSEALTRLLAHSL